MRNRLLIWTLPLTYVTDTLAYQNIYGSCPLLCFVDILIEWSYFFLKVLTSQLMNLIYIEYQKFRWDLISVDGHHRNFFSPKFFATKNCSHRNFRGCFIFHFTIYFHFIFVLKPKGESSQFFGQFSMLNSFRTLGRDEQAHFHRKSAAA